MGNYKEIILPTYMENKEEELKKLDGCSAGVVMALGDSEMKKGHILYDDSWPNNYGFYLVKINQETNKLEKELLLIHEVGQLFIEE